MDPNPTLIPTRRLNSKERRVFDRVASEFNHLTPTDEEQITQYAEAVVRYSTASKDSKKRPTVTLPVVNRSTGNVTGQKIVRNTSFATLKEAQAQINSLARRLMIDAHSAEKRLRYTSKKSRSAAGVVASDVASNVALASITEAEIQAEIAVVAKRYTLMTSAQVRAHAIWRLTDPYLNPQFLHPAYRMTQVNGEVVEDTYDLFAPPR
jgi:hypothetical protein